MKITVLFFAAIREAAQRAEMQLEFDGISVGDALIRLESELPPVSPYLARIQTAVNEEYCRRDTVLNDGDVLALVPPVSGGCR